MPIGGAMASRPLHFIWLLDCSGSMRVDGKIQALNNAIQESLPHMRRVAEENPHAQVLVRVITFSTGAAWHVQEPTPIDRFTWTQPVRAEGVTDAGAALTLLSKAMAKKEMPDRALPPVLVLVSDGQPTDDFNEGLKTLLRRPWGAKARRLSIAIGRDADRDMLQRFIGDDSMQPLTASCAEDLVNFIKWASTAAVRLASHVVVEGEPSMQMDLPPQTSNSEEMVW